MSTISKNHIELTQTTLREPISFVGVGLHSGSKVSMTLRPAAENTGAVFVRKDAPSGQGEVPAIWYNVFETHMSTAITNEYGYSVNTIEHLMAAFRGCGIDNVVIELDGPEVPILDGSALPYCTIIESAGKQIQNSPRRAIWIRKPITVHKGDKYAILVPDDRSRITVEIDFPGTMIGQQKRSIDLVNGSFARELAGARTFGFANDVESMLESGLALGGSLRNAILVDGDHVVNPEGLRFADEFVRHKILDCLGDLSLVGMPIFGHYLSHKPGHDLNNSLIRKLYTERESWKYVTVEEFLYLSAEQKPSLKSASQDG
ncbi:MAG: UDP-3-O-acyl-N-acetylglucosamine deacetylase [Acidiferrobacterales bacterium]